MRIGINYPWIHYDWDFGEPPRGVSGHPWGTRADWYTRLEDDLNRFRRMGFFAVRWWLLGSGLTYGVGADAPQAAAGTWRVATVPALTQAFIDDFRVALRIFRSANMQVMPVFCDFHMFLAGRADGLASGFVKGGRRELIADATKRPQFLHNALRPLLDAASTFRDVIYAWDLINEPEWCVTNPGGNIRAGRNPTLDRVSMLAFLREGVTMINRADYRSSIGFAQRATVDDWNSIDLQVRLHQFHYYGSDPLPHHTFHPDYPLIVGEFASALHRTWPDIATQEARDSGHIVLNRLRYLERQGYPVAFIWAAQEPAPSVDPGELQAVDWSDRTRAQVCSYVGRSIP